MAYRIRYTPDAELDLRWFRAHEQQRVRAAVLRYLADQPDSPSGARKRLDPNSLGLTWELRVGDLRVFYDLEGAPTQLVRVERVGRKVRERVVIRGAVVEMRLA